MIARHKKAPARAKAHEEYILSTKMFCGNCWAAITGISGIDSSGKKYCYYQCSDNRKKSGSQKQLVKKEFIEELVFGETKKLLTIRNINMIAREIMKLLDAEKKQSHYSYLEALLNKNEKETKNLLDALKKYKATDILLNSIEELRLEKEDLERHLAKERLSVSQISKEQIVFFLEKLRDGDIKDIKYQKTLAKSFIDKIYLFDNKIVIIYTINEQSSELDLDTICSSVEHMVEARGVEHWCMDENMKSFVVVVHKKIII